MDSWIIGTKLFILLYCIIKYFSGDMKDGAKVLLLLLIYISINMIYYIFKADALRKLFLGAVLLFLMFSAYYVNILFIFMIPLCSAEFVSRFTDDLKIAVAPSAIVFLFQWSNILPEYLLAASFSLCIYILSNKAYDRIAVLTKISDGLREKNDTLYKKLDLETGYEEQLKYLSQMEERNSLAQNIHDKVGHSIAGSLIQLEAATVMLEKDQEKAKDIIRNVINVLKEGMENIRLTLRNIKPATEQLGINRLKTILDEFSASYGIRATLSYSGNLDAVKHSYWRIIMDNTKEALTNVLKYSSASAVTVKIEVLNKLVRIEIKDNGIGAFLIKKGLGLHGMEERVENAGGRLIIDGTAGFSVIMLLPVTSSSEGT